MRDISRTSTVTRQDSPSHSRPVAASDLWPVSSSTVVSAARASSMAERFPSSSALAIPLLSAGAAKPDQTLQKRVLGFLDLVLAELACLTRGFQFLQACHDRRLVVLLVLSFSLNHAGQPHRPAHRRQRQGQQSRDQAHAALPMLNSAWAKLNGGTGPTYRISIRSPSCCRKLLTASLNSSVRSPSTRNARLNALG